MKLPKALFRLPFVCSSLIFFALLAALCGFEIGLAAGGLFYSLLSLLSGCGLWQRLSPLGLCLLFKFVTYQLGAIDYLAHGTFNDRTDLLERSAYLQDELSSASFGRGAMPAAMDDFGKEEWVIGTLSMATAAVANIAFIYPETQPEALKHVERMIKRMLEPDIRVYELHLWHADPLEALASNKGQIGYLGHLNFMLGAYRFLGGNAQFNMLHDQVSAALARRMRESKCIYLETFPDMIFIPDNMAMVASLELYNKLHDGRYEAEVNNWVNFTKSRLVDQRTGVISPYVSGACQGMGVPRGSYAGWNSFYLPFIDPDFARDQYAALKETFIDERLGIFGIREYPKGIVGPADVDSGPIILGLSTSGTGFVVAGARRAGDLATFARLLSTAELAGTTVHIGNARHYIFAPLVGESIMLAMKSAVPWELGRFDHK